MMRKNNKSGFTLVELLLVVSIIGMLSTVVMTSMSAARSRARDTKRITEVRSLTQALALYYTENGQYPSVCGGDGTGCPISALQNVLSGKITRIPTDPSGTTWHTYQYVRGSSDTYGIYVRYEKKGYCKLGMGVDAAWWGSNIPICE